MMTVGVPCGDQAGQRGAFILSLILTSIQRLRFGGTLICFSVSEKEASNGFFL